MNIKFNDFNDLKANGIYIILNTVNRYYYVGSTVDTFEKRLHHHYNALKRGNHKNPHLQHAWNKYGESKFLFIIYEILTDDIRNREQFWLTNRIVDMCYNINSNATGPLFEKESLKRHGESMKKFYKEFLPYYKAVKNGEMQIENVPEKFHEKIKATIAYKPWNKGKKYESTDHLKVKKSKIADYTSRMNKSREKEPIVFVYNSNWKFIDAFRSASDLEDLSESLNLPIGGRFSKQRGKSPLKRLNACGINKAIKMQKPYKGLYFLNKPLNPGMDDRNEPKSVKTWKGNTEVNTETKESVSPYSVEIEPDKSE